MKNVDQNTITQAVLERMGNMPDARLKTIVTSLVHHLHDFARGVQLTEQELMHAIEFLTQTGQKCDDKRQEFILLSDVLGLSMLTIAMNQDKPAGCTEPTVFGPFFLENAPHFELGADVSNGASGQKCLVRGHVKGLGGEPVKGAKLNVWQADDDGKYDVQYENLSQPQARGILNADDQGHFYFTTILAEAYPIPTDGPVGTLLNATKRHPWRPAHLHFMVEAPGYERLITHVFRDDDDYLQSDVVFGVRSSLLGKYIRHEAGKSPDGQTMATPFYTLNFDFVLAPKAAP
ncbi:MAG: hydroxyquinol 1,2-dioxygenase [Betaproteobacteria bacterium]|nr:hydroxyquinol 1,2-dioxygenase [Betaproteobacteria bacterium]